jgi:uncharacterized phage protein (TIGR02220 family)
VLLDTPKFKSMSSDARHVFHVLKLTRLNNMAGIFVFDLGAKVTVADQTGISIKKLEIAIRELIDNQYVIYEEPILWLRNQVKHDPYVNLTNPKHVTAIHKVLNGLPSISIIAKYCNYYKLSIPIGIPIEYQSLTIGSVIAYTDPDPDPDSDQNNHSDTDPDSPLYSPQGESCAGTEQETFEKIIADLNQRTGSQFHADRPTTQKAIRARIAEGYTFEDFLYVHRIKCAEWLGSDMAKYLNPQTLYRPGKFEKYRNQKPSDTQLSEAGRKTLQAGLNWLAKSEGEDD